MIQLTLIGANAEVHCGGATSESFPAGVGLGQGGRQSVLMFNIAGLDHQDTDMIRRHEEDSTVKFLNTWMVDD